jgi:hypothetical protein
MLVGRAIKDKWRECGKWDFVDYIVRGRVMIVQGTRVILSGGFSISELAELSNKCNMLLKN